MKLTGKKIKSMLLCMMLTMAMAITAVGCGSKTENTTDTQKNTEISIVNTESTVETEAVAEAVSNLLLSWWMQMETRQTLWSAQIKKRSATLC